MARAKMAISLDEPSIGSSLELSFQKASRKSWVKISKMRTLAVERIGKVIRHGISRRNRPNSRRFKRNHRR